MASPVSDVDSNVLSTPERHVIFNIPAIETPTDAHIEIQSKKSVDDDEYELVATNMSGCSSLFGLISYDDGSSFGDSDIVNDVVPGLFCRRPSIERVENEQAPSSPNRNMTPVRSPVNNTRSQSVSPYVRS